MSCDLQEAFGCYWRCERKGWRQKKEAWKETEPQGWQLVADPGVVAARAVADPGVVLEGKVVSSL